MSRLPGAFVLALLLLGAASVPTSNPPSGTVSAQTSAAGRVLGATRGQVAWIDLVAPRPSLLTKLQRPDYPADAAAIDGLPFAVVSVVSAFGTSSSFGGDLVRVDLQSGETTTLVKRGSETESLDMPAIWPDGSAVLYQRSDLRAAVPTPGQAAPQYRSRIEQIETDGSNPTPLLDDARYPAPSPDGSQLAFVRSTSAGVGLFTHVVADGTETTVVPPGQFLALAYPRYSPDAQQIAFAAVNALAPAGRDGTPDLLGWLRAPPSHAHGFPWEVWIANADGTNAHAVPDVLDDDPSVAWSPDGTRLLVYGGWGSYVVDVARGSADSLPYIAGYGSVAWLPD